MTLAILLFAYLLSQFYRAFLAAIAADLARDLALSPAELGSLPAAFLMAFALAQFPIGLALDRIGPRRTLSGFFLCAVVGAIWFSAATHYGEALAALALIGAGVAPVLMAAFFIAARNYPVERFSAISALMIGIGSLGDPLSATPLALAAQHFGWRPTMLMIAAITALAAVAALFLRDPPRTDAKDAPSASLIAGILETLRFRPLWTIFPIMFVGYAVVVAIRGLWISPYLESVHGLDTVTRSLAALGMGLAIAAGALLYAPAGRLIGNPKRTVLAGTGVTAAALVLLACLGAASVAGATALIMVIGAAGLSYGTIMTHARIVLPIRLLARGVTFLNFLSMTGAAAVQWASGRFIQATHGAGWSPAWSFGGLFFCFAVILLTGAAIYARSSLRPSA